MRKFEFVNEAAKKAFLELPKDIMKQFGTDLQAVQNGERPFSDHTNIKESVGPGAIELIENGSPAYRAVYCAKYDDTVFVLHAFTKTTNGVDRKAMKTAKERYKEMLKIIKGRKEGGR
ncbi:type II toxin-antitoxin system RelE/ParE family toxin [Mesorhizobium sp. B2-4-19]|uniref:type II toxin-antitoxin system RelE/ParE family toxin n=1 Tax=Mesorhizobium sp. B2-4-19 TaxID=2589930 RepID=UPI00112BEB26|nr:type II toxin-antitoxin system RelE/ParE family toxin [Mesorhizobium sp. B2-4-19]TPK57248.1 type II toxin-antitoxin system RelE/ParE family toxin [Mesorhizobium sp. B2-4-19]